MILALLLNDFFRKLQNRDTIFIRFERRHFGPVSVKDTDDPNSNIGMSFLRMDCPNSSALSVLDSIPCNA